MTEYSTTDTLPDLDGRKWILACATEDFVEDEGLRLTTIPPVSVFFADEEVFCIDDTCTHETYSLAEGWVEDCVVECSLHLAKFSLRTGEVVSPPATTPLAVHPVTVVGDDVYVALPAAYLVKEGS